MANLETKFEAFETQVASQHTAIANKLDAILMALGAPPPTATTTLADIATLLNAINNNLIGVAIANGSFHTAVLEALENINLSNADLVALLDQINTNTDLMLTNNSGNAQLLVATLLQTACPCDPSVALLPPPFSVIPTTAVDEAKCRRIQYFLDLFRTLSITIGQHISQQGSISSTGVNSLLQLALLERGIEDGELRNYMPNSIRDSVVYQLTAAIRTVGAAQVDGGMFNIVSQSNLDTLRDALYSVNTAAEAKSAFDTTIVAIGGVSWITSVIKTLFYSAWPNDIYSAVPIIDDSAYDGEICAPPSEVVPPCVTISSVLVNQHHVIQFPPSSAQTLSGDFYGSVIRVLQGVNVHVHDGATLIKTLSVGVENEWTVDVHTSSIVINTWKYQGGPSVVEWCDIHNAGL